MHRLFYPISRLRYLRVHVFPEAGNEEDKPTISSITVFHTVIEPGEYQTLSARLEPRQATPVLGAPGSTWFIDFEGGATWCQRLHFEIEDADFARNWELSAEEDDMTFRPLTQGEWRRRPGAAKTPLEIDLPTEVLAKRLRLQIVDDRNKPLNITKACHLCRRGQACDLRSASQDGDGSAAASISANPRLPRRHTTTSPAICRRPWRRRPPEASSPKDSTRTVRLLKRIPITNRFQNLGPNAGPGRST